MAERKGDEINQKIVELENELRAIIFDRHHHNTEGVRATEDLRQLEGHQRFER